MGICTLIVNPSSGGEMASSYLELMETQLRNRFEEVTVKETGKQGDAMKFAYEAAKNGHEAVFCMGGDGTVNDLARALGIPLDPGQAIEMFETAVLLDLDIGKVNDRYFVSNVAAGAIPEAVEEVSVEQKTKLGPLAYFIEGGKALANQPMHRFRITVDEETFTQESPLLLIALTNSIASFERFMPQAEVDDGKMRMVVFKEFSLLDSLKILPQLIMGELKNSDTVIYRTFKHATVAIADGDKLITNVDGDEGPAFPLEIAILPSFIKVYGPARS